MFPLLLLTLAAPRPLTPSNPLAEPAVLPVEAQWEALAACPRILMRGETSGTATGVAIGFKEDFAYVLTAQHVIPESSTDREVQFFEQSSYPRPAHVFRGVEVVWQRADPDLALLKVRVGPDPLPTLQLARPGERPIRFPFPALSVGCTEGRPPSCHNELVIGKRPARRKGDGMAFFWELDMPSIVGRSGGPLLDGQRRVIGICAAAQGKKGYFTHSDEILAGLKQDGYGWLWQKVE